MERKRIERKRGGRGEERNITESAWSMVLGSLCSSLGLDNDVGVSVGRREGKVGRGDYRTYNLVRPQDAELDPRDGLPGHICGTLRHMDDSYDTCGQ